uniref:Uncharacterized protein n=1 Tax=Aureoumbra lagunensis TaxID=44058 RepID=A0A7S3K3T1_9STRA
MIRLWFIIGVCLCETVVRIRLGNGSVRRVFGNGLSQVRSAVSIDANEPIFLDEACSVQAEEDVCLSHGSMLYLRSKKSNERANRTSRWDPYPKFALKKNPRMNKRVINMAQFDMHEITKPQARVCTEARVGAVFERLFDMKDEVYYVYGRRDTKDGIILCETFATPMHHDIATALGLQCVGYAVIGNLTASHIVASAFIQLETMRTSLLLSGSSFPFVLLVASQSNNQTALEAFEVSEHLIQIAAEGGLRTQIHQHDNNLIHFSKSVKLQHQPPTETLEAEWLYQPVPIVQHENTFFVQADHPPYQATKKAIDNILVNILVNEKSTEAQIRRLPDFLLLNRFRALITKRDFQTFLTFLRDRYEASLASSLKISTKKLSIPSSISTILRLAKTKLISTTSS